MSTLDRSQALAAKIDEGYLIDVLTELAKVPTEVPLIDVWWMVQFNIAESREAARSAP